MTEPDNEKLAPVEQLRDLAISMAISFHRGHSAGGVFAKHPLWNTCDHPTCSQVRAAVAGVNTHPWPTCDDESCPGYGTAHAPIPPNPGLTVIERINRIGVDLSVLLELNDAATSRTPLVSEAIRAIGDDDATTVLQLFSWDDTVCLRRARTVLADAVDRFDDRKRGVDGDPNPFESMIAVYHLACGCTVESGPGETRLMVGQQWACPGGADAGLQEILAVTFTDPSKGRRPKANDDEFAGLPARYTVSCGCTIIAGPDIPRWQLGEQINLCAHGDQTVTRINFDSHDRFGMGRPFAGILTIPAGLTIDGSTERLLSAITSALREEVTPQEPPTT